MGIFDYVDYAFTLIRCSCLEMRQLSRKKSGRRWSMDWLSLHDIEARRVRSETTAKSSSHERGTFLRGGASFSSAVEERETHSSIVAKAPN